MEFSLRDKKIAAQNL